MIFHVLIRALGQDAVKELAKLFTVTSRYALPERFAEQ
jgi:hypothetical protein